MASLAVVSEPLGQPLYLLRAACTALRSSHDEDCRPDSSATTVSPRTSNRGRQHVGEFLREGTGLQDHFDLSGSAGHWIAEATPPKYGNNCAFGQDICCRTGRDGLDGPAWLSWRKTVVRFRSRWMWRPRPWVGSAFGQIEVPDDASALVEGLPAYGA
jgi:hypothetical protein